MSLEMARTEIVNGCLLKKFSYMWTIYRFMKYFMSFDYPVIESPIFSSNSSNRPKWRIHLYPNGENEENSGCLSIFLILLNSELETEVSFTFSILNAKGDKVNQRTMEKLKSSAGPHGTIWGFRNFAQKEYVFNKENELLAHFMLTICCEISFTIQDSSAMDIATPIPSVCQDFEKLLETGRFSDVSLLCKGREFRVHKNILAARSPVFSAMFEHDMRESQESLVEILDLEPEAIQEMLRFIYTSRISNNQADICDIINAANKYQLDELKSHCETVLSKNVNVENAVFMLILADQANATQLKDKTMQFILANLKEISDSMGFKALGESQWCLMKEILTSVALHHGNRDK